MTDPKVNDRFVQLSQILTGFGPKSIGRALDRFNFLQVLQERAGLEATEALLARYQQLKDAGKSDREIGYTMLHLSDPRTALLARTLMKLWYLGQWFQPYDYGPYKSYKPGGVPVIVDPGAYAHSLAGWAAQAKPVGTFDGNSAYPTEANPGWAGVPPPLSEFTE